ncbi:MAG: VOC family protein [Bacteroidota bacterium]
MEARLSIITLGVADVERASEFYEQVFGWTKAPSSNENIRFFQLNGLMLALYAREALAEDVTIESDGSGFKGMTIAYCTRSKAEVDELIGSFEAAGIPIVKRPEEVFWGGYSGYIADPDGYLWEIAYNPFMKLDEAGNVLE